MKTALPAEMPGAPVAQAVDEGDEDGLSLVDLLLPLAAAWRMLLLVPLLVGFAAYGATYLIDPIYTARTVFLPPQQQQSPVSAALAQLGALSGLSGNAGSSRNSTDQYIALMQSTTVVDRMIDRFGLTERYEKKFRSDTRTKLLERSAMTAGKKDGLITVAVEDENPERAAQMANQYVEELRQLTNRLALSEAQQRRAFFESQLHATRDRLTQAQVALQASGFTTGALRAEPRAAAEGYARLRAEATAAEVRLSTLRNSLADDTPEVQSQRAALGALRAQLARLEANSNAGVGGSDADYIGKYREFKYQETLFDLFSKQYEIARVDEAREGALIQVVDTAQAPDKRTRPKRVLTAAAAAVLTLFACIAFVGLRRWWRGASGRRLGAASASARLHASFGSP